MGLVQLPVRVRELLNQDAQSNALDTRGRKKAERISVDMSGDPADRCGVSARGIDGDHALPLMVAQGTC